ncbi:MAG: OsmC family protein [Chloroflexi bacterium]|nr:OsmC family protein [Chloroflexota bacterium]
MRKIPAGQGHLTAEVVGDIEQDPDRVLVVRRIHVTYRLRVAPEQREAAIRAHNLHARSCPMARSIGGCIAITTTLQFEEELEDRETGGGT